MLVGTLLSRQPRLRKAAADTLRHLAERDAHSVLPEQIEPVLFAALDSETGARSRDGLAGMAWPGLGWAGLGWGCAGTELGWDWMAALYGYLPTEVWVPSH